MSEHEKHSLADAVEFLVVTFLLTGAFAAAGMILGGVIGSSVMQPSKPVHLPPPADAPAYVAIGGWLIGKFLGAALGAAVGLVVALWREAAKTRRRSR